MSKFTVLLVEDDESLYNLYSTEFDLRGHTVVWHNTGDGVVDKVKKVKPDLILLDIMLPGKSGLDILKEVKAEDDLKNIPVFMLTNFGTEQNVHEALENGADDFVMKHNIVPEEIVTKIEQFLE